MRGERGEGGCNKGGELGGEERGGEGVVIPYRNGLGGLLLWLVCVCACGVARVCVRAAV